MKGYEDLNLKDTKTNAKEIKEHFEKTGGYVHNGTGTLKKVLMCPADYYEIIPYYNVVAGASVDENKGGFDYELCKKQHKDLVKTYLDNGVDVELIEPTKGCVYQIFARDFGCCVKEGVVLGRFKERARRPEIALYEEKIRQLGMPIVARATCGTFEGGDFFMVDEDTLIQGFIERTNKAGFEDIECHMFDLGYDMSPVKCQERKYLHLDVCLNIIAPKVVVMCTQIMPRGIVEKFTRRGYDIIEISPSEVIDYAANIQGIGNGRVISSKTNTRINSEIEKRGLKVIKVDISEIVKGGGGIHCMTFPLIREAE